MNKFLLVLFMLLIVICGHTQDSAITRIYPQDESRLNSGLATFIDTLKEVSIRKDTSALYKLLFNGIVTSHGGAQYGKEAFILRWQLDSPGSSPLWKELSDLIKMGGVFDSIEEGGNLKVVFQFPYATANKVLAPVLTSNPKIDFDPYGTLICINKNIPVYNKPDIKSKIVSFLSYDVVLSDISKNQDQNQNHTSEITWVNISTLDNKIKGWANGQYFCGMGDLRMIIEQENHIWKITDLAAFD
jgi:hypothetical protein